MGQAVIAILIVFFAWIKGRRDKTVMPLVLVPRSEIVNGFETSIRAICDDMGKLVDEIDKFLKAQMSDPSLIMRIEVCSEELLKNVITHGYGKEGGKHYIDYRLSLLADEVRVVISDDGKAFNPVEYDKETGIGLLLVRGMCADIKYDYLFRQNITKISSA